MNMPDAVRSVLTNYANFNGRARRSEYWWWVLAVVLVSLVLNILEAALGTGSILSTLFSLAILVPGLAVGARRLHDTGKSGWLLLIGLIPLVGFILLIVWFATDSQGDNQYGPSPKGVGGASPFGASPSGA